jgi:hypothetical protein
MRFMSLMELLNDFMKNKSSGFYSK